MPKKYKFPGGRIKGASEMHLSHRARSEYQAARVLQMVSRTHLAQTPAPAPAPIQIMENTIGQAPTLIHGSTVPRIDTGTLMMGNILQPDSKYEDVRYFSEGPKQLQNGYPDELFASLDHPGFSISPPRTREQFNQEIAEWNENISQGIIGGSSAPVRLKRQNGDMYGVFPFDYDPDDYEFEEGEDPWGADALINIRQIFPDWNQLQSKHQDLEELEEDERKYKEELLLLTKGRFIDDFSELQEEGPPKYTSGKKKGETKPGNWEFFYDEWKDVGKVRKEKKRAKFQEEADIRFEDARKDHEEQMESTADMFQKRRDEAGKHIGDININQLIFRDWKEFVKTFEGLDDEDFETEEEDEPEDEVPEGMVNLFGTLRSADEINRLQELAFHGTDQPLHVRDEALRKLRSWAPKTEKQFGIKEYWIEPGDVVE